MPLRSTLAAGAVADDFDKHALDCDAAGVKGPGRVARAFDECESNVVSFHCENKPFARYHFRRSKLPPHVFNRMRSIGIQVSDF